MPGVQLRVHFRTLLYIGIMFVLNVYKLHIPDYLMLIELWFLQ